MHPRGKAHPEATLPFSKGPSTSDAPSLDGRISRPGRLSRTRATSRLDPRSGSRRTVEMLNGCRDGAVSQSLVCSEPMPSDLAELGAANCFMQSRCHGSDGRPLILYAAVHVAAPEGLLPLLVEVAASVDGVPPSAIGALVLAASDRGLWRRILLVAAARLLIRSVTTIVACGQPPSREKDCTRVQWTCHRHRPPGSVLPRAPFVPLLRLPMERGLIGLKKQGSAAPDGRNGHQLTRASRLPRCPKSPTAHVYRSNSDISHLSAVLRYMASELLRQRASPARLIANATQRAGPKGDGRLLAACANKAIVQTAP
ncbi:hypothetical protein BDV96DRAFT_661502 [Lophiotrema nucula]|uniref:Uncharacterized protein n=1 Tax=Lophiotrema nucula TaxID=690887 RepID=A0A6A5Z475_9PLEO|nr:hypothetical protein BDV96DRAFT_661502 [Lophiotrema nucula]